MRKAVKLITLVVVFVVILTLSLSSAALASNYDINVGNPENPGIGPAPNSGDGVPDGPGW